ncbi:response regulator [Pelagicoccus sp. NFK12]|uniref:histidine kinase n=1 Tax=Pelagicoccus enzymogenes TaxID=2773457 RepID=A0A927IGF9_9BACT|nr:response regulator [Pelagicoccus enzymogenes]MBD5781152.1 response regulator [Pelagicoccus enzymogenes]
MSSENSSPSLPPAPNDFLQRAIPKVRQIAKLLSSLEDPDDVLRYAVEQGRHTLNFSRLSVWFFDGGFHALKGTFGVDPDGNVVDERHNKVFDHGTVGPQRQAWETEPYYFHKTDSPLRDSEGGIIARGVHFTAPLYRGGELTGYLSVDDLIESPSINAKTGPLLCLYAEVLAGQYYTKLAEQTARHATKAAERADDIKREFLGMLGHEVRTPLNAILGFAQLLCLNETSQEQRNLALTIEQSGDHLLSMLSSMMDYANLADRDLSGRYQPCDPIEIARETVDSFTQIARSKNLHITFRHLGDFEGTVMADPIGLRQILSNLVQNAIKFTDSGSVRVIAQSQPKPNGSVAIQYTVEDTGCGIAVDQRHSVFEPFKQIDSSLTRAHGGIGMGLAIVNRLVSGMRGQIQFESETLIGTSFKVDFQFDYASDAPDVHSSKIGTRSQLNKEPSKLKILIAEDNANNRLLLEHFLRQLGYPSPTQANDGETARTLIERTPYDFVLLDLQMPEVDGLTLTRMIRNGQCGSINRDVPIIGLTAHNIQYDRDRAISAGMDHYLTKPFKIEHLRDAIELACVR